MKRFVFVIIVLIFSFSLLQASTDVFVPTSHPKEQVLVALDGNTYLLPDVENYLTLLSQRTKPCELEESSLPDPGHFASDFIIDGVNVQDRISELYAISKEIDTTDFADNIDCAPIEYTFCSGSEPANSAKGSNRFITGTGHTPTTWTYKESGTLNPCEFRCLSNANYEGGECVVQAGDTCLDDYQSCLNQCEGELNCQLFCEREQWMCLGEPYCGERYDC